MYLPQNAEMHFKNSKLKESPSWGTLLYTHPTVMPLGRGIPPPPTPEVLPPTLILIENPGLHYMLLSNIVSMLRVDKDTKRQLKGSGQERPLVFWLFLKVLKIAEFWHVGFVLPKKHCSSFLRNNVCKKCLCFDKLSRFFAIIREGRPGSAKDNKGSARGDHKDFANLKQHKKLIFLTKFVYKKICYRAFIPLTLFNKIFLG